MKNMRTGGWVHEGAELVQKGGSQVRGSPIRGFLRKGQPVFRKFRSLFLLFLFVCGAAFVIFGGDPSDGGRSADNREFLAACEGGPFAAANASDTADAARLCACLLSWHRREGSKAGAPLPVERYRSERPVDGRVGELDNQARDACRSGRVRR